MKAYLVVDETAEGDFPVGIYSTPQKAFDAVGFIQGNWFVVVREYEIDDPATHNYELVRNPQAPVETVQT